MQNLNWIWTILRVNWANMMSHPKAFYTMTFLMLLQNLIYFGMWVIVFSQISSLRGWGLNDIAFLYALGAIGYGLVFMVFGGMNQLAETIHSGALDVHLARPRPVLLLATMQRMRGDSLGDVLTGLVMILFIVQPALSSWPLIITLTITASLIYSAFRLIVHSLAFWGQDAEGSERGFTAFIIISTNPQNGFSPVIKMIMLTVFPAAYVGLLPVQILQDFSWPLLAVQVGAAGTIFVFALWFFHYGLRRYTSGNQMLSLR